MPPCSFSDKTKLELSSFCTGFHSPRSDFSHFLNCNFENTPIAPKGL